VRASSSAPDPGRPRDGRPPGLVPGGPGAAPAEEPDGQGDPVLPQPVEVPTRFLDDVEIEPSNNLSERLLRVDAIGRRKYLFVGHEKAGRNTATLASILQTCVLHNVDPQQYLADVLVRVQDHPQSAIDDCGRTGGRRCTAPTRRWWARAGRPPGLKTLPADRIRCSRTCHPRALGHQLRAAPSASPASVWLFGSRVVFSLAPHCAVRTGGAPVARSDRLRRK